MIQAVITAMVAISLAFSRWSTCCCGGPTRLEALRRKLKIIFLVLSVCGLCSKVIVHAYKHFNPPPPPIIGP